MLDERPPDPALARRISRLRWRRRLFLVGPPLGFATLGACVITLSALGLGERGGLVPWVVVLVVTLVSSWCALCLWWAPAARCPSCSSPMGGASFSARNALWVWSARPRCPKCRFDPFGNVGAR